MLQISMELTRMPRGHFYTCSAYSKEILNHYLIRHKEFKPVGGAATNLVVHKASSYESSVRLYQLEFMCTSGNSEMCNTHCCVLWSSTSLASKLLLVALDSEHILSIRLRHKKNHRNFLSHVGSQNKTENACETIGVLIFTMSRKNERTTETITA